MRRDQTHTVEEHREDEIQELEALGTDLIPLSALGLPERVRRFTAARARSLAVGVYLISALALGLGATVHHNRAAQAAPADGSAPIVRTAHTLSAGPVKTAQFNLWITLAAVLVAAAIPSIGAFFLMRGARTQSSAAGVHDLSQALTLSKTGLAQWEEGSEDLQVSDSLFAALGYGRPQGDRETAVERGDFLSLFAKDYKGLLGHLEIQARSGNLTFDHVCLMLRRDGTPVPMRMTGLALPGDPDSDHPRAMRFAAILSDASKERALAGQTRQARLQFRALLDGLSDGAALWDSKGHLVAANRPFAKRLGRDFKELTAALHIQCLDDTASQFERDGKWFRLEKNALGRDGMLTVIRDVTDELAQTREAEALNARLHARERDMEDLSAKLKETGDGFADLERRLHQEAARAEAAEQAITEFLANASHELRTPLNAILGFSEMMKEEMFGPLGNEKYKEYITDIHASGQSLLNLIKDILDMTRFGAGDAALDPARLDIPALLDETARLANPQADAKGVVLTVDNTPVPSAFADAPAVKRILLHLLSNAIKHTDEGGTVTLSAKADLRMIKITVADTGTGIDSEELQGLGKPFVRTRQAMETGVQGIGLGLAMARTLAELSGGHLGIESELGKGTTVTVALPRRATESAGDDEASTEDAEAPAAQTDDAGTPLRAAS